MKVGQLIKKAHLIKGQKIVIQDVSNKKSVASRDRYDFNCSEEEEKRLMNLRVNSFYVHDTGINIWAEERNIK